MSETLKNLGRSVLEALIAWVPTALAIHLDANYQILGGDETWLANPVWQNGANITARAICLPGAFLLTFWFRAFQDDRLLKIARNCLVLFALVIVLCIGINFTINGFGRTESELVNGLWKFLYVGIFIFFTVSLTAFLTKHIG